MNLYANNNVSTIMHSLRINAAKTKKDEDWWRPSFIEVVAGVEPVYWSHYYVQTKT